MPSISADHLPFLLSFVPLLPLLIMLYLAIPARKTNCQKYLSSTSAFHARVLNRFLLQPDVQPQARRPPQRRRCYVVIRIILESIQRIRG